MNACILVAAALSFKLNNADLQLRSGPFQLDIEDLQLRSGQLSSAKLRDLHTYVWRNAGFAHTRTRRIGLYRIIGNPLPPRHHAAQLWDNLKRLLYTEKTLPRAKKIFVLNRLTNASLASAAAAAIISKGHTVLTIPFDLDEYAAYQAEDTYGLDANEWGPLLDPRYKRLNANLYLMNNNGARNFALEHGRAKGWAWTLPFDGNCFFRRKEWAGFVSELDRAEHDGKSYAAISLIRLSQVDADTKVRVDNTSAKVSARASIRLPSLPAPRSNSTQRCRTAIVRRYLPRSTPLEPTYTTCLAPSYSTAHPLHLPRGRVVHMPPAWLPVTPPPTHFTSLAAVSPALFPALRQVTLLWKLGVHGPWDSWRDICIPIVDGRCNPGKLAHPPNVCIRPETADAAAIERTVVSNHSVYRLPDQAAGGSGHGLLTAGEGKLGQRLRGRSRELGIANKIAESLIVGSAAVRVFSHLGRYRTYTRLRHGLIALSVAYACAHCVGGHCVWCIAEMDAKVLSTRPAGPFVKPLFFNVVSMESMRRECLLAKPAGVERRVTSPKPNSAQVHCLQRDALVLMARARLPLPLISITDKVHSPAYATPAGASVRHYTNLPLYDWRVSELVNLSHQCKARDSGFVRCDGHVRPGGTIWGPGSEAFDRTRSYELHSNLTLMALAHFYTGDELFAAKGVELARAWWLDEDTAMLPTLEFAHYSRPRGGRYFGVIEMKV
ncbi:hypothetical protein T492DRAFT_836118 [Pavlovales sp. CCMP2436]|nr:hypothetical protein T492DRAFT_836118 [Pavlovales sp. CCMP2436]